jgi:multimeric flavodoxin WrbA
MQVTILNGNPDPGDGAFEGYLRQLTAALEARGHQVTPLPLRDLDVKPCNGCFGCWIKNPGDCVVEDDARQIRRAWMAADLALLASPVQMGFYSPLLKKCVDKLLPNLLPFISIYGGECHHDPRYERYPRYGMLLQRGADTDDEDLEILREIGGKQAFDMKTELSTWALTDQPVEEVADAIDRL